MHLLRRPLRFVTFAAAFGAAAFALVTACSDQTTSTSAPNDDDASDLPRLGDDGGAHPVTGDDGSTTEERDATTTDSAPPKKDGSTTDATTDAMVDASPGAACTFNRECPANQRCECDEVKGCFCFVGIRGTGQNGVTECTDGNDCQSSLCVEGAAGKSYCSDECTSAAGCKSKLPVCSNIVGIGKICVRQ